MRGAEQIFVDVMGQRREGHLWLILGQLRYPLQFR
jgi:hypothetical protein